MSRVRSAKSFRRVGNRRQVLVVLGIGALLGLGAFGIDSYSMAKRHAEAAAAAAKMAADDEIYTGSILYVPDRGNMCRQLLFDNLSGQFSDNGYVDCQAAALGSDGAAAAKHWPMARVRVISTGFRDR